MAEYMIARLQKKFIFSLQIEIPVVHLNIHDRKITKEPTVLTQDFQYCTVMWNFTIAPSSMSVI